MLETNGSLDIGSVDNRCIKIVDIKCPGSGESDRNDLANLHKLNPHDQVKFVIGSKEDYAYATELEKQIPHKFSRRHILFSPAYGVLDPAELAGWIVKDRLTIRLHLQLHKLIWPGVERGV
jgi:7-carboxy-7-deazaguanine synthase